MYVYISDIYFPRSLTLHYHTVFPYGGPTKKNLGHQSYQLLDENNVFLNGRQTTGLFRTCGNYQNFRNSPNKDLLLG